MLVIACAEGLWVVWDYCEAMEVAGVRMGGGMTHVLGAWKEIGAKMMMRLCVLTVHEWV